MWKPHPFRALKRIMPRGLFGRSLIIIVAPVVILQGIVTYAFFERHYDVMLGRMGRGAAADRERSGRNCWKWQHAISATKFLCFPASISTSRFIIPIPTSRVQ